MSAHLLSIITFLPFAGALVLLAFPRGEAPGARGFAMFVSLATFVLSMFLWRDFIATSASLQFVERVNWIPSIGATYLLGIDGLSLFLIVLTTLLTPIVILSSYSSVTDKVREYLICMLILETAMLGTLAAQDMLLFYVFWEAMLIPMYFLIGVFGGKNRIAATIKFFVFTMAGSVLMLVSIIYLYLHAPSRSFELAVLTHHNLPLQTTYWLFGTFALAFAIKVPMFPVHTWLPDAHVEAPTGGSVILAGVLLKMGTYGFLRFAMPLFPRAAFHFLPVIATLAVIGIVYGALVAMVQKDIKKVVAYSSVSHLGFVMLGVAAMSTAAVSGAVYQMLNHGISTGALFLLVGVIYERRHTRQIKDFGGLAKLMPWYATIFLIVGLSSIGLPGLNGFVGEFMIMAGTIKSPYIGGLLPFYGPGAFYVILAALGVIFAAVYILWMYQRVFFGPVTHKENEGLTDLSSRETLMFAPLLALIVFMGVMPRTFLLPMEPSLDRIVTDFQIANGIGGPAPQAGQAAPLVPSMAGRPADQPLRALPAQPPGRAMQQNLPQAQPLQLRMAPTNAPRK